MSLTRRGRVVRAVVVALVLVGAFLFGLLYRTPFDRQVARCVHSHPYTNPAVVISDPTCN